MNSSEPVGTVRALWRFPVKSMLGEQLDVVEVGDGGMVGDRGYVVRDRETGKVASAKHPKLWPACSGAERRLLSRLAPAMSSCRCGSTSPTASRC